MNQHHSHNGNPLPDISSVFSESVHYTDNESGKYFALNVQNIDLFRSVTVSAKLYDSVGQYIHVYMFEIVDDEYAAWNNDDQYLVNLVAQKLGFTTS